MDIKLTVFFEEAFWVGVFERVRDEKYSVAKVVFGPEPKNHQIMDLINNLHEQYFSEPIPAGKAKPIQQPNPKRLQRLIGKEMNKIGMSTKAQEAMRLHYESDKKEKRERRKNRIEEEKSRKYELKQQKRKEKHRGH